jgi:cell division protease FtsH
MKKTLKNGYEILIKNFLWMVLILISLSLIFGFFSQKEKEKTEISLSELAKEIQEEKVKEVLVIGNNVFVTTKEGKKLISKKEGESSLQEQLLIFGVDKEKLQKIEFNVKEESGVSSFLSALFIYSLAPLLLLFLFFWWLGKQTKAGTGQIFDFTRAKPKILGPGGELKEKVVFDDIGDLKEAKEELKEVVDFLKNPKKYLELGARIPRGILLVGAPGTGKTLLAKAIASMAGVPFFSISGSEFMELFVGVGSARIRSLFEQAKKAKRAIIFIDEIDSIGKLRGIGVTGGHEEREQTLNQLLAEMDGISREEEIIVLAATNKPEVLDPALLRPGRFDRRIVLDLPDLKGREEILKIHCRNKPLALDVNLKEIAERTPGFSGADLANLVNEASLLAGRKNKKQIFQEDFLEAIEKVLLGPERKSHLLTEKEKEIAAFHEVGHALVSAILKPEEPVRKVSIIARGFVAGYTLKTPTEERKMKTKSEFLKEISILLGGYVAEQIKFKEVTTGAENDLKTASYLARKMVKEYGMSPLGPIVFGEKSELEFLGVESEVSKNYSEKLAEKIDKEVENIIKQATQNTRKILSRNKKKLEKIAKILIEKETIEKEEFENLIGKQERKNKNQQIKIEKIESEKVET